MSHTLRPAPLAVPKLSYRAWLLGLAGGAFIAGFAVMGSDEAARAVRNAGPELARLLQMMALLKLTLVAAGVLAIDWRLRQPVGSTIATAYLVSAFAMAAGPGLVWNLAHLVIGAALLHGGLLAVLVLSCIDGGMRPRIARSGDRR